jgi:enoyl-CoA hydratase/carnithine racemase
MLGRHSNLKVLQEMSDKKLKNEMKKISQEKKAHLEIEELGSVLIVRVDGGKHGLFGLDIANELDKLVDRVDKDANIHGVVFTGTMPDRFISHADVQWLQEGGVGIPPLNVSTASAISSVAHGVNKSHLLKQVAGKTKLRGILQLDHLHETFLKMNRSGVIFVAALNGSALGLGAEFAWACDFRVMADGDFFIGQPEILLGIIPGGGGTQRLPRLIGNHAGLKAILEGKPFTPAQALANGAVDEVVPQDKVVEKATEVANYFGSRTKIAIAGVKRAVYFGGSMSLPDGLQVEHAQFLVADQSKEAQELMLDYQAATNTTGELPFYNPETYANGIKTGRMS